MVPCNAWRASFGERAHAENFEPTQSGRTVLTRNSTEVKGSKGSAIAFLKMVWGVQPQYGEKGVYGAVPYKAKWDNVPWKDWPWKERFTPTENIHIPSITDLYFCPFLFTAKSRQQENCLPTRWLYADLDESDPVSLGPDPKTEDLVQQRWALQPTLAWKTSHGRWQAMWLLDRPISPGMFAVLTRALCRYSDADAGGTNAERKVFRVPGSISLKHGEPQGVELRRGMSKLLFIHRVEDLFNADRLGPYLEDSPNSTKKVAFPEKFPSQARARQILQEKATAKTKRDLKRLERTNPIPGQRSDALYHMYQALAEDGIGPKTTLVLLKDNPWRNKFPTDRKLWDDILRVRGKHRTEGNGSKSKAATNGHPTAGGLILERANMDLAKPIRWAWRGRWVLGSFNLLLGEEGIGKGTLAAWMLSQWSQGQLPGVFEGEPVGVGVVADEDSWNDVWTPRLHAARFDDNHVWHLKKPEGGFIRMVDDKEDVAELIRKAKIKVLYLDALMDNLGATTDEWKSKDVREALEPMKWLAEVLDIAIIGSVHPNKKNVTKYRQLMTGSAAFNQVPRSGLYLAPAKDDDEGTKRVLMRGKGNLGPVPPSLEFHLDSKSFSHRGKNFSVSQVVEVKEGNPLTADEWLSGQNRELTPLDELIKDMLERSNGKGVPISKIYEKCEKELGVSHRAVRLAGGRIGIRSNRSTWAL